MIYLPTMEEILKEQEKLDLFCTYEEFNSIEIFSGNAFYGHALICSGYHLIKPAAVGG